MVLQLPIEQRIDKSYILLRTPQGEEILKRLRQIQMAVNQKLKQKVEFQKFENNQGEKICIITTQIARIKAKLIKTKSTKQNQNQKFKQLLSDIENQDFREIMIDDKTIEESLNSIFLEHFTKNQALLKEQAEQIKYAKEVYEQQYREQYHS
ncbi:unnamed protein product [Paramecium sonneborni]|uniref:Uncharacterized protein n=1 Tax=Paramecium sonneborni TaxID=65129 RepID=A0A8S1QGR7_9CILI|nr:unnamed protein product [Paramecium sonneborni]